ncbi:hypothetical protein [Dongia sp. agr-C8]
MLEFVGAAMRAARPAARVGVLTLVAAIFLGGCVSGYKSEYDKPDGKVLLVSKDHWADFQKYLGDIGSTRDGAFAMGVNQGHSDGWASSSCPIDACYGSNTATEVMRRCRQGGECVLFAIDDRILVNYKIEE